MTSVGIRELKTNLSAYLRRVKCGDAIQVTDHGRPVAFIRPAASSPEVECLWRMVEAGQASWGGGKPRGVDRPPRISGKTAAARIIEDRR